MPSQSEDFVQNAKKIAICLQSVDKTVRKEALIKLENLLTEDSDYTNETLRDFFTETYMYTLNGFRDKNEIVREQAIKFMRFLLIDKLPLNDFYLTYVCPVLVERIGSVELIEESEEIRLELVKFLQAIILKYSNTQQLKPFIGDCVIILCESVKDKHPAIKELSCRCVIDLAYALPKDFHMQAESLVKPIVSCFGHQRFRVRVEALNAIGEVIMHSSYKGLDEAIVPIAEKLFDQIPLVRRTVAQVAARWLLEYRDRYSFFYKILPLLLTGLNDEVFETRLESQQLWEKVGEQYQKENENDLKDQMDFLLESPKYYPTDIKRPNLGCRVLVQRNVCKLAKALSFELTCWQEDIRVRCSQLLCSLALHAEDCLTQNLQDLLPAMYSAARDEDKRVTTNIVRASELMGIFIPIKTWFQLILPIIEDGPHYGHLVVLYGFIKGTPTEYISHKLEEITSILSDHSICFTRKKKIQVELKNCVDIIVTKHCAKSGSEVDFHLFKILISLISLRDPDNTMLEINLLRLLSTDLQYATYDLLWQTHVNRLLVEINKDPRSWLVVTSERAIFEVILMESGISFGQNLCIIVEILKETLHEDGDPESRLKTFYALSRAFENKSAIFSQCENLTRFLNTLITDVFVPSLIWHPGVTAESLRTMALACLVAALSPMEGLQLFDDSVILRDLYQELVPLLISLMEDASYRSRQLAIECCSVLKLQVCQHGIWETEDVIKIYPEILKRLDDPTEKVRLCALTVLPSILAEVPSSFKEPYFRAHHELIIDTLMTHFDDDSLHVRNLVFDIMKIVATINLKEVAMKMESHKLVISNQQGCIDIQNYLKELTLT